MKLDSTINAETPEGIAIRLRPAGARARLLAYSVDWMIRMGVLLAANIGLSLAGGLGTGIELLLMFGLEWLYPIVFELMPGAATPGKRALGLQVTMDDGLPVTPSAAVVRNLLRAADFMPFLYTAGLASMLLRRDFKRLGDLAAGTLVVHVGREGPGGRIPEAAALAPRVPLQRAQQVAILQLAGRSTRLTPERFEELAALAHGALPPGRDDEDAGRRLLAVAQWLVGQR